MKRQWILWGLSLLLMLTGVAFAQMDRSGEAAALLNGLESASRGARIDAANAVDEMAWLCKALGASGNAKYAPALEQVAASGNKKLAKFAQNALQELR
ncbi:MAG: hypothetical protein RBT64_09050 [Trichloromonas sp.]|jgi:hypothetical protein|nr:hypothetical protein [Trichloromonas sp.]